MDGNRKKRKGRTVVMTRRELLRSAGVSAAVGASTLGAVTSYAKTTQQSENVTETTEAYEQLTAEESRLLEAIADHLIPSDDTGPGALDANAVRYIDRALGGALSDSLDAYRAGLAAFQRYCRSSRGGDFMELSHNDRIYALIDVETGAATVHTGNTHRWTFRTPDAQRLHTGVQPLCCLLYTSPSPRD